MNATGIGGRLISGVEGELEARLARVKKTGDPIDGFNYYELATTLASDEQLPDVARTVWNDIRDLRLAGDGSIAAFPNASVHAVVVAKKLRYRIKIASFLLRFEYDEKLRSGDLEALKAANLAGDLVFQAGQGLMTGFVFLNTYFGPLLASMNPAFWGYSVNRSFGAVIYSLGGCVNGLRPGQPAELLQLLIGAQPSTSVDFPRLGRTACSRAIDWWTARLNRLLDVVSDPTVHVIRDGSRTYSPVKHLQSLLTIEQMFRRVLGLQVSYRDVDVRRALMFDVLDSVESLTGINLETLCDLSHAQKVLDALYESVPSEAADVLLGAAQRAIDALRQMQEGFFVQRQGGRDTIEYLDNNDQLKSLTLNEGVGYYLKIVRNSIHGYGGKTSLRAGRTNALLSLHDGSLPEDLPLLAYLYLLHLMLRTDVLRRGLYARRDIF